MRPAELSKRAAISAIARPRLPLRETGYLAEPSLSGLRTLKALVDMRCTALSLGLGSLLLVGCGGNTGLRMTDGSDFRAYVQDRNGSATGGELAQVRFKPSLCDSEPMQPEHGHLNENDLVEFLVRQHLDVRVDRPRADLVYLIINGAGTESPVRVRVAILNSADQAGAELHEALLQHGEGAWGVHRSNLAALVPTGPYTEALAFAAKTKLACWGVFTAAGMDDTFVVPGGYFEL